MSWLLVAFIPGLLMLATFGLDRLEAGLERDRRPPRRSEVPASPPAPRAQPVRHAPLEYAGQGNTRFPATRQANRV